ncbi:MAG: Tol-Pal system beta propeller repeat protein TolB [Chlorobiaceae bacterium]|nr:Tol-Pal system beta propeller repeat protein TolB [Chlorobiaceae bacterium]
MRLSKNVVHLLLILFVSLATIPLRVSAAETGEYIAIRKEGSGKIAIVLRQPDAKGNRESGWAQNLDTVIHEGLAFTGLFNILPAPLNIIDTTNPKNPVLNFGALNSVGSEIYAGGKVTKQSGEVVLDMEVYETLSSKQILKKTYTGREEQIRSIGQAFCADLVQLLTGKKSVFGTKIAFVSTRTGTKEIYECDFDGQNIVQLTSSRSISLTPVFSPDGHYLAWTDFTSGRPNLYIRDLTTNKTVPASKNGVSIDPGWRNNNEVATTLSFEGDQEIYLIRPDGSIAQRVTRNRGIDVSPTFSPDGGKMAFVSSRNGLPQIFVQDMGSGAVRRLTFSGRYNTQPSWSPVGDKIAYTTWENGSEINIFVINADGSGLVKLTSRCRENESPSWSPDGDMIVFTSNRDGKKKLYVMNASGENQRPLVKMDGEQMQPSWSLFRK